MDVFSDTVALEHIFNFQPLISCIGLGENLLLYAASVIGTQIGSFRFKEHCPQQTVNTIKNPCQYRLRQANMTSFEMAVDNFSLSILVYIFLNPFRTNNAQHTQYIHYNNNRIERFRLQIALIYRRTRTYRNCVQQQKRNPCRRQRLHTFMAIYTQSTASNTQDVCISLYHHRN